MSYFNDLLAKLFPPIASKPLFVKEVLKRDKLFLQNYQNWLNNEDVVLQLKVLSEVYYTTENTHSAFEMQHFEAVGANGLAIFNPTDLSDKSLEFHFLLEYWKDQCLKEGYMVQVAERHLAEKNEAVEEKLKYYLKPTYQIAFAEENICNQLYGNILLELVSIQNTPQYLKILFTHYKDYYYKPVLDYQILLRKLFEINND